MTEEDQITKTLAADSDIGSFPSRGAFVRLQVPSSAYNDEVSIETIHHA